MKFQSVCAWKWEGEDFSLIWVGTHLQFSCWGKGTITAYFILEGTEAERLSKLLTATQQVSNGAGSQVKQSGSEDGVPCICN